MNNDRPVTEQPSVRELLERSYAPAAVATILKCADMQDKYLLDAVATVTALLAHTHQDSGRAWQLIQQIRSPRNLSVWRQMLEECGAKVKGNDEEYARNMLHAAARLLARCPQLFVRALDSVG
jgi:hypothetical protein